MEEKQTKTLYKKWWFWLIILIFVIVIAIVVIMLGAFSIIKGNIGDLALEIQDIHSDATVYTSAGNNTLYIELENWNSEDSDKLSEILQAVKSRVNNNELQLYSKMVTLAYIESSGKENALLIKHIYSLPDFKEESKAEYILFDEYQELFDKYSDAMKGYTSLFNSMY